MIAFGALLLRDLAVLRKNFVEFILRTVMQPLLFVFVFTYVFPQIGQGVGGQAGQAEFSSILVPGVIAIACIFQGIQAVALPLVQEFGFTREIEDRVMAPLPVWSVAAGKLAAGAVQGLVAALAGRPSSRWKTRRNDATSLIPTCARICSTLLRLTRSCSCARSTRLSCTNLRGVTPCAATNRR